MTEDSSMHFCLGNLLVPRNEKVLPADCAMMPYIGLDDIEAHSMRRLGFKSAKTMKSAAKCFRRGDVLYSRLRPYLNKVWKADRDGICSSEFIVLPENSLVNAQFLAFRLNASDFVSFANSLNAGDRPRVDFDQISSFIIPPFSLSRQKRIVAKIEELFSELDAGVESIKQARAQLGVYRQALLKKAFEGKLTEQWRAQHDPSVSATPPSPLSQSHLPLATPPSLLSQSHLPFTGEELCETRNAAPYQDAQQPSPTNSPQHQAACQPSPKNSPPHQAACQPSPKNSPQSQDAQQPFPQNSPPFQGGVAEGRGGSGWSGYITINNLPHLKTFRKQLRNKMTPAEARLWTYLKGKQLDGRKFRRQHSVGNYILDFYCPEERLAIELDGEVHHNVVAAEYDYERDLFLQHTGIKVLRFENRIVFENSAWLLDQVKSNFGHLPLTTPPSLLPQSHLPLTGEELYEMQNTARIQETNQSSPQKNSPPHQTACQPSPKNSAQYQDAQQSLPKNSPPFQGGVAEGRGGSGWGGLQLLERIRIERQARYQQQLDDWHATTTEWEKQGNQGKKPAKPRQPKPVEPLSAEDLAELSALPEGWAWTRLGESIVTIDAGKSFACEERPPNADEIGVAKVSAVSWGDYNERESKTCKDSSKEVIEYLIKPGDFLLSRANTIDLVGACVIVKNTKKMIMLSDKTLRINFVTLIPEYALQYLRCRTGRREIMKRSSGNQESMRNIGQDRVCAISFPLCSIAEQREIVRILEEQFTVIEQNEQEIDAALARSEALRQSILKKAFSGRLVPQDPNDEPASVLLERIRTERANAALSKSKTTGKTRESKSPAGGRTK